MSTGISRPIGDLRLRPVKGYPQWTLPREPLLRAVVLRYAIAHATRRRQLELYKPHPKQLEAHALGRIMRAVGVFGGNRTGKSVLAGSEVSYHLTGRYPYWWPGRRYTSPVTWWVASESAQVTRDGAQRLLLGPWDEMGTGLVPADCIGEKIVHSGSVKHYLDTVKVKHVSGKFSTLSFRSYDQGRKKFQSASIDGAWLDEEPPKEIFNECLMRVYDRGGYLLLAFTPLSGMTEVCLMFLGRQKPKSFGSVTMSWADNIHLPDSMRLEMIDAMLPYEREAREKGIPVMGKGRVYTTPESVLRVQPFNIPSHWPRGRTLDFGWDHPTAALLGAKDPNTSVVYIYWTYKLTEQLPDVHARAILAADDFGDRIPTWADPSGLATNVEDGRKLFQIYADEGLHCMPANNEVYAGLVRTHQMMARGQLKVFATCEDWFDEYRLYHRDEKGPVKINDDLMDDTRYLTAHLGEFTVPLDLGGGSPHSPFSGGKKKPTGRVDDGMGGWG